MDGYQFTKKIKEVKPDVKVFFMSAYLSDYIQFRTGPELVKVDEYIEKPISISHFVSLVRLMLSPESNQVKLEFKNMMNAGGGEVVSHSDDIFVVGDRNRITQVISNLLDNALKFTSEGVVSVDVARKRKSNRTRASGRGNSNC